MIIRNAIQCNHCGDIIESKHVHDFQTCKCGCVSVDGGYDYLKRCFQKEGDYTELSETKLTLKEAIYQARNFECENWQEADCLQVADWLEKLEEVMNNAK